MREWWASWFLPRETGIRESDADAHVLWPGNRLDDDRAEWRVRQRSGARNDGMIGGMNDRRTRAMEVYIGEPVEHESERSTLREIERLLAAEEYRSIVFANFSVASHQIDMLVARDGLALVIEAKGMKRPVRGGENGSWEVRLASGHWKEFGNPYRQTLAAALAVKDAIRSFSGDDAPYIDAALVFAPCIPRGSRAYQGDRKVSVIGHETLGGRLRERRRNRWSGDRWRAFAEHLRLTRVSSVSAACDTRMADAEKCLRRYTVMFRRTYEDAEKLVPFSCGSKGEAVSSAEIANRVFERNRGLLLHGPTGCGKSMLAASAGAAFGSRGGVTVSIQGKDFEGRLKDAINREASLLGVASGAELLSDAHTLGRPILFIVDGYNECAEGRRGLLTRAIAALAYRYDAGILVTSQVPLTRGDLLDLERIDVPPPSMETKLAISYQASEGRARLEEIEHLLTAISTGLEARLAGEVGGTLGRGSSRYALFDAFARERLDERASDCIRALSQVAAWLFDRLSFSMSVRDFDRLMDRSEVSGALGRLILDRGLLASRGDRVSFPHDSTFGCELSSGDMRLSPSGAATRVDCRAAYPGARGLPRPDSQSTGRLLHGPPRRV